MNSPPQKGLPPAHSAACELQASERKSRLPSPWEACPLLSAAPTCCWSVSGTKFLVNYLSSAVLCWSTVLSTEQQSQRSQSYSRAWVLGFRHGMGALVCEPPRGRQILSTGFWTWGHFFLVGPWCLELPPCNLVEKVPRSFSYYLLDLSSPIAIRCFSTDL